MPLGVLLRHELTGASITSHLSRVTYPLWCHSRTSDVAGPSTDAQIHPGGHRYGRDRLDCAQAHRHIVKGRGAGAADKVHSEVGAGGKCPVGLDERDPAGTLKQCVLPVVEMHAFDVVAVPGILTGTNRRLCCTPTELCPSCPCAPRHRAKCQDFLFGLLYSPAQRRLGDRGRRNLEPERLEQRSFRSRRTNRAAGTVKALGVEPPRRSAPLLPTGPTQSEPPRGGGSLASVGLSAGLVSWCIPAFGEEDSSSGTSPLGRGQLRFRHIPARVGELEAGPASLRCPP